MKRCFRILFAGMLLAAPELLAQEYLRFEVFLYGHSMVPPVETANFGNGVFLVTVRSSLLTFEVSTPYPRPRSLEIHGPAETSSNGPLLYSFTRYVWVAPPGGGFSFGGIWGPDDFVLRPEELRWLKEGRLYAMLTTDDYPDGLIRGQIVADAPLVHTIRPLDDRLHLEWTGRPWRYQLQQTSSLDQPWENVGGVTTNLSATVSLPATTAFFRVLGVVE